VSTSRKRKKSKSTMNMRTSSDEPKSTMNMITRSQIKATVISSDLKCGQCPFTTHSSLVLERHHSTAHRSCSEYQCLTCDFKATSSAGLDMHHKAIHSVQGKV
jgi:hypothetical protein